MSRGPGVVQRRIMAELASIGDQWMPLSELCGPSPSERESARRAVQALAVAGKVETRMVPRPVDQMTQGGYTQSICRMVLAVRGV